MTDYAKIVEEKRQAVINGNAEVIEKMWNFLKSVTESDHGKLVTWGEIDRKWVLYDYLGTFFADMTARDAQTLVNYVAGGANE